jgi:hypothetical protein
VLHAAALHTCDRLCATICCLLLYSAATVSSQHIAEHCIHSVCSALICTITATSTTAAAATATVLQCIVSLARFQYVSVYIIAVWAAALQHIYCSFRRQKCQMLYFQNLFQLHQRPIRHCQLALLLCTAVMCLACTALLLSVVYVIDIIIQVTVVYWFCSSISIGGDSG